MPRGVWKGRGNYLPRDEYLTRTYEFARRGHGRLTDDQVRLARSYHWTAREAAEALGVHYRSVEKIRSRAIHVHVDDADGLYLSWRKP